MATGIFLFAADRVAAQSGQTGAGQWSLAVQAGRMTNNGIDEVFLPGRVNFADQRFAGLLLGYEVPLRDARWEMGVEVQLNRHFGKDTFEELVVPATIRYSPARPWWSAIDSFAFGLGLSYATETPQLEILRRGGSQRALIYFSLESAFSVGRGDDAVFLRLHHRSDGYGLFAEDSGSNAFAVGYRKAF